MVGIDIRAYIKKKDIPKTDMYWITEMYVTTVRGRWRTFLNTFDIKRDLAEIHISNLTNMLDLREGKHGYSTAISSMKKLDIVFVADCCADQYEKSDEWVDIYDALETAWNNYKKGG